MESEKRKSEELSVAIDALSRGERPPAGDEETRQLVMVAAMVKAASPPPALAEALAAKVAAELKAKTRRRRWLCASSAFSAAAAVVLVVALNLPPAAPPPPTPLVIPPAGSVVIERLPVERADSPTAPASRIKPDNKEEQLAKAGDSPAAGEKQAMLAAGAPQENGVTASAALTGEKTLFATDRFAGWDWHKGAYPRDMAFAVVAAPGPQAGSPVPAAVLSRAGEVDYGRQLLIVAYLGTGGGADAIGIERVTVSGREMAVRVRTKSIGSGQVETMNVTTPADFLTVDRNLAGSLIQAVFTDQKGAVLATIAIK